MYSFGVVLWELWEKKRPFDEFHSRFDIMDAVKAGKRPPISDNCPPPYRSLVRQLLASQPSLVIHIFEILLRSKDAGTRLQRDVLCFLPL